MRDWQQFSIDRARGSIERSLARTVPPPHARPTDRNVRFQEILQAQRHRLQGSLAKLDSRLLRVAVFGAVSRGKSAVLNALFGRGVFQTGPLNGVTQWTRSLLWTEAASSLPVELIDTPGIDEVEGGDRASMAESVAQQADVILFVVAGDITRTEYAALCRLWDTHKPLLLVFNKTDLYPERDRQTILQQLRDIGHRQGLPLTADEIACVAADPKPRRIRYELPDGRREERWETPPPDVRELKDKLERLLQHHGEALLALNALVQARDAETQLARALVELRDRDAEDLIWKFARYKAAAIAVNPVFFLDVVGGTLADLMLVRSLARLYDLPMTSHEAGKLLQKILVSGGGFLVGELVSSAAFGIGKTAMFPGYLGAAVTQAAIAGYGTYTVGQAAKVYLERGCTWGASGADTVIREILAGVDRHSILARLRREILRGDPRQSEASTSP